MVQKTPAQLDREETLARPNAAATFRVGQLFERWGHIYEVTKIGRDKKRTVQIARRVRDLFGKEILIDYRAFSARDCDRECLRSLDPAAATRKGWPPLVR